MVEKWDVSIFNTYVLKSTVAEGTCCYIWTESLSEKIQKAVITGILSPFTF